MGVTTNDSDLLDRYARCGDEAAFRELVRQHLNLVYSSASRRVGDGHLAEDVTQAVFMILAQKANAARRVTPLSRWLLATVRYASANALKLDRRRRHHERSAAASRAAGACSANPSDVLVWQEIAAELDDAVLQLSTADRTAVLLRFFEQKPISAVAQVLNTTEAAAGMRVTRAVEKLRQRLDRRGVGVAPSGTARLAALVAAHAVCPAPPKFLPSVSAAAVGAAAGGAASAAIAQGAITMMAWTKINTTAALVAATAILGTVSVVATNNGFAQGQNSPSGATAIVAAATQPLHEASAGANDVSVPVDANEGAAPATQPRRGRTSAPARSGFSGAAAEQELPLNETERELVGRYVEVSRFPVAWTFSADRRYEVTTLGEVVERGQWHVSDHRELVRVIEEDNNVPDRVGTVDVRRIQNLSDSGLRVQVLRNGAEGKELSYKRIAEAPTTARSTRIGR